MALAISLSVFCTTLLGVLVFGRYLTRHRAAIERRIGRYVFKVPAAAAVTATAGVTRARGDWRSVLRWLSRYLAAPNWSRLLEHRLIQAGVPLKGTEFVALCLLTSAGAGALSLFAGQGRLWAAILGGLVGWLFPLIWLHLRARRRCQSFNRQLGDALILVANSLRSGYSFLQAIEMVSREMSPPISVEFRRLLKEMNLGVPTEDALNNLAKRIDSADLDLVITAVLIQRQVGGNLAEVLENIAGTIAERVKIRGEIKTLTAQGRISGLIIGLLPPVLFLILYAINPEYMALLFTHPLGKAMVAYAVASLGVGIFLLRRIVNIEV